MHSLQYIVVEELLPYEEALQLQLTILHHVQTHHTHSGMIIFCEHPPVYTYGTGDTLPPLSHNIPQHAISRGGQATYHGPGQLVIYPIVFIKNKDIRKWLHFLENCIIFALHSIGIIAYTKDKKTGVWVGEKKIASIGIGIKKWVSFHGIALNITNDLEPFFNIMPCGMSPDIMTRVIEHTSLNTHLRDILQKACMEYFLTQLPSLWGERAPYTLTVKHIKDLQSISDILDIS